METWQAMKDEGYDILRKLEDNCLLEDGEEEDCVRMHDLVRDMALNITRTNPQFLVKAGLRLKKLPEKGEWTENLEKASLMRNFIKEIPSNIPSSKCTMLTTLVLSHNNLLTIPESIFEYMPQLKILDLSYNQEFSSLPDSLSKLVNLTTLLLQATSLIEVPSLSNLRALKKLDLCRSGLEEIPKGLEMLTNLKYLDISGNRFLEFSPEVDEIANGILSNLSELQYLVVSWEIALKGEVIGGLVKLEGFGGRFPTCHELSIFFKCLQDRGDGDEFNMYAVDVASHFSLESYYCSPLELEEGCNKSLEFNDMYVDGENTLLLPSIQELVIQRCNNLRSLNDISAITDAKELKCCVIRSCQGLECVLSSSINPLVQKLKVLDLYRLEKLDALFEAEAIAKSPLPPDTFSSLKAIIMEEIIAWDVEEAGREKEGVIQLILPTLKSLKLRELPALKSICSICSRRAVMVCDSLEVIWIDDCKSLTRIPLYLPLLDNGQPSPPPSLKQINVWTQEWGESWWESLEWDHPNAKDILQHFRKFMY
ncbi:hypothetical protein SLEP1_g36713 [Rubroshorea leprosula]|uniref:Uncharacterized protein n=1 Tax=Rubroshorea leprosula TaxID=152421 RepID=A0AAV5KSV1_9ROSI|nr:hypothetical protein SLEP1_g36713 [Rubroshorea leprosula]